MAKKNQSTITRKPPKKKQLPQPLEDQVLSLTPSAVRGSLPLRIGGEFGLDVIVKELGGPEEFAKFCRLSTNPKIQNMVRVWDQTTQDVREMFSFQELCKNMMIDGIDVMTDIVTNLYLYHGSMARIMNALSIKDVMATSIEVAKTPEGIDDRKIQLGMAGLMPKQGPLVNVNVGTQPHTVENMIEEMDAIDVLPESQPGDHSPNGSGDQKN